MKSRRFSSSYQVEVSREVSNPEWDAFVEATAGGTYQQSSMWAQVKAVMDWRCARIVLRREGRIVAGCQILLRPVPWAGAIAYVSRGPVVADHDPHALKVLFGALDDLAKEQRIHYLKLQPPPDRHDMAVLLKAQGFVESSLQAATTITVRVDLSRSTEALLGGMRRNARTNIRKAQRLGVLVRQGGEADLEAFGRLVEATSRRQGFLPYPQRYYEQMWRAFAAGGHAQLLVAEHDGVVLSSNLLLSFGESVVYKMGAWSGTRSRIRPNELLHWIGMQWGQEHGRRYYDFDGINPTVGRALLAGGGPPAAAAEGVANFKLGFGGDLVAFPVTYDQAYWPLFAGVLRRLAPQLHQLEPLARRVLTGRGAGLLRR
jgi:peptidoglycan pentaglycine glycine transferase (the first glycine)